MARKNSKFYKSYMRERRRVQRLVNKYKKIGVEVNIEIPKIPKRITQGSINRLSKITPQHVSRETFIPTDTGELISVYAYQKTHKETLAQIAERVRTKLTAVSTFPLLSQLTAILSNELQRRKDAMPAYDEIIISNFLDDVSKFPDTSRDIIMNWFNTLRESVNDDEKIADMLEDAKAQGIAPTIKESYNPDKILSNLTEMFNMLDISAGEKNAIIDDLDYMDSYLME